MSLVLIVMNLGLFVITFVTMKMQFSTLKYILTLNVKLKTQLGQIYICVVSQHIKIGLSVGYLFKA